MSQKMSVTLEVEFHRHSPKRTAMASFPWPYEQLPRVGEQIYGMGMEHTYIEGVKVRSLSWCCWDEPTVTIFGVPVFIESMDHKHFDHDCGVLEMFGWNVSWHVPTLTQNELGEWVELDVDDDDSEGANA